MDTFDSSFEHSQYLQVHLKRNMNYFFEHMDRMWFQTVTSSGWSDGFPPAGHSHLFPCTNTCDILL